MPLARRLGPEPLRPAGHERFHRRIPPSVSSTNDTVIDTTTGRAPSAMSMSSAAGGAPLMPHATRHRPPLPRTEHRRNNWPADPRLRRAAGHSIRCRRSVAYNAVTCGMLQTAVPSAETRCRHLALLRSTARRLADSPRTRSELVLRTHRLVGGGLRARPTWRLRPTRRRRLRGLPPPLRQPGASGPRSTR